MLQFRSRSCDENVSRGFPKGNLGRTVQSWSLVKNSESSGT